MVGHALVVGVPGGALRGVENDAHAMTEMLAARGFAVDLRIGATRAAILAGYEALIAASERDAPAVFYFAGHGFRGPLEDAPGAMWQGIVPSDMHENATDDFRGITAVELSFLQATLTQRTRNVTTILDCCFASQMSRVLVDAGAVRALPHPARLGFASHVQALRARYGLVDDQLDALDNPNAVRVVACGQAEGANEARRPDGRHGGVLTMALLGLLAEVGDAPVSWSVLADALRHRVQRQWPTQRPEIEGPVRRELFSLREARSEAIGATLAGDGGWLHVGRVAGVAVGDVYGVMPIGATRYRAEEALSTLTIRSVRAMSSDGELDARSTPPSREALAFAIEKAVVPRPVALFGGIEDVAMLEAAIADVPGLARAQEDEREVLARVHVVASEASICDARGLVCTPFAFPAEIAKVVSQLAQLAVAQRLRELEGAHGIRDEDVALSWGMVEHDEMRPLQRHGCTLALSDRPYVRIGNRATRRLYAHVLGLGLRGEISILTSAAPSGVELRSDRPDFVLGQGPDGRLRGLHLGWSPGVPRDAGPRLDELIVIVAATRGDLRTLSTGHGARARLGSALETRRAILRSPPTADDSLWVGRISFALEPGAMSTA